MNIVNLKLQHVSGNFYKIKKDTNLPKLVNDNVDNLLVKQTKLSEAYAIEKISKLSKKQSIPINITTLISVDKSSSSIMIEKIKGQDLVEHIRKPLIGIDSRVLCRMMVKEFTKLHSLGFAHRDIKPSNMMISNNKKLYIIDFEYTVECKNGITKTNANNSVPGTLKYCAPELHFDIPSKQYNAFAADVYALGVSIYTVINQKLPYSIECIDLFDELFPYHVYKESLENREKKYPEYVNGNVIKNALDNISKEEFSSIFSWYAKRQPRALDDFYDDLHTNGDIYIRELHMMANRQLYYNKMQVCFKTNDILSKMVCTNPKDRWSLYKIYNEEWISNSKNKSSNKNK